MSCMSLYINIEVYTYIFVLYVHVPAAVNIYCILYVNVLPLLHVTFSDIKRIAGYVCFCIGFVLVLFVSFCIMVFNDGR